MYKTSERNVFYFWTASAENIFISLFFVCSLVIHLNCLRQGQSTPLWRGVPDKYNAVSNAAAFDASRQHIPYVMRNFELESSLRLIADRTK